MSEKSSDPANQQDRQEQFRKMAAQMQTLSPQAITKLKRELRRRAVFAVAGGVVISVGAWMNPARLGIPPYISTIVMLAGAALALLGMLGLSRGIGCMAYVTAFFWLLGLSCGLSVSQPITLYILAGTACAFALVAILIPKSKQKSSSPLEELTLTVDRTSGKSSDKIIDTDAKEINK